MFQLSRVQRIEVPYGLYALQNKSRTIAKNMKLMNYSVAINVYDGIMLQFLVRVLEWEMIFSI